jgi:hypothetical protein
MVFFMNYETMAAHAIKAQKQMKGISYAVRDEILIGRTSWWNESVRQAVT